MDLTVAICMYNAEKYIEETLKCISNQTKHGFHLMIINDCCTDNSVQLIENYFKENPRQYEIINLPVNRGLCAGRRYVEENATTQYIMFVDSDDCPYPTLIEELYDKISSDKDLIAVGCHLEYIGANGEKLNGGIFLGETTKEGFYKKAAGEKLIFMQPTAIYDRKVALSVGGHNINGFPDGKPRYRDLCEDLDLWTRMSDLYQEGKAIVVIPKILCRYRKHESAMSTNSIGMLLRMRHIKTNLKRRRRSLPELSFIDFRTQMPQNEYLALSKEAKAADLLRCGYYSLKRREIFSGCRQLLQSFYINPTYLINKIKHNLLRL